MGVLIPLRGRIEVREEDPFGKYNPIPPDAFPASDPDPEVMEQLRKEIMEERRQRNKAKKSNKD